VPKRSFGEVRSQAGAWDRGKKLRACRGAPRGLLSHVARRRLDEVREDLPWQSRRASSAVPPSRVSHSPSRAKSARPRRWGLFPKESAGMQRSVLIGRSLADNGSPRSDRQPGTRQSISGVRLFRVAKPARPDREFQKIRTRSRDSYTPGLLALNRVQSPHQASAKKPQRPGLRPSTTESRRRANPRLSAAAQCPSAPAKVHRSSRLAISIDASVFNPERGDALLATGASQWVKGPKKIFKPPNGGGRTIAS
jgi:hypothetical protein